MTVYSHPIESYREALDEEQPVWALREAVREELQRNGDDREAVVAELEEVRDWLEPEGRDSEDDTVLDVIGFVVGFSGPHVKL